MELRHGGDVLGSPDPGAVRHRDRRSVDSFFFFLSAVKLMPRAVLSAFVDLYLAVYPGTVLARLGIKRKKKIALIVALGLGCM